MPANPKESVLFWVASFDSDRLFHARNLTTEKRNEILKHKNSKSSAIPAAASTKKCFSDNDSKVEEVRVKEYDAVAPIEDSYNDDDDATFSDDDS